MQPITFQDAVNQVTDPALRALKNMEAQARDQYKAIGSKDQYEDDLSTAESLRFWLFDMHSCDGGRDNCQTCYELENADLPTLKEMYRQATLTNEDRKVMHDTALGVENL